jgi:hypothetical protein
MREAENVINRGKEKQESRKETVSCIQKTILRDNLSPSSRSGQSFCYTILLFLFRAHKHNNKHTPLHREEEREPQDRKHEKRVNASSVNIQV